MDWPPTVTLETITGVHIALWLVAYAAWRHLTCTHSARRARASRGTATRVAASVRRPVSCAEGRWARRAAMLDRLQDERAVRHTARRRLQRAA